MTRASWSVSAVVVVALLFAPGCTGGSSSDDAASGLPEVSSSDPGPSNGDACDDTTGDLSDDAETGEVVAAEPAGIDLVSGTATLEGDTLEVVFTTAGPVETRAGTEFVLAQGVPFSPLAFEVRADSDGEDFAVTLVDWPDRERRQPLAGGARIDGSTITLLVPSADIPPLANYLAFGSRVEIDGGKVLFDECNPLATAPTVPDTSP